MSAMEQMAKNLILSLIPPEVMKHMTEENFQKAVNTAKLFVQMQNDIRNTQLEHGASIQEILENVRSNSSRRKPSRGGLSDGGE